MKIHQRVVGPVSSWKRKKTPTWFIHAFDDSRHKFELLEICFCSCELIYSRCQESLWIHKIVKLRISSLPIAGKWEREHSCCKMVTNRKSRDASFLYVVVVIVPLMNADNAHKERGKMMMTTGAWRRSSIEERREKQKSISAAAASVYAIKALFYANVWLWKNCVSHYSIM